MVSNRDGNAVDDDDDDDDESNSESEVVERLRADKEKELKKLEFFLFYYVTGFYSFLFMLVEFIL